MTQYVKVAFWLILVPSIVLDVNGAKLFCSKIATWAQKSMKICYFWLVLLTFCMLGVCSNPKSLENGFPTPKNIVRSWNMTFCLKFEFGTKFYKKSPNKTMQTANFHSFGDSSKIKVWKNSSFLWNLFYQV